MATKISEMTAAGALTGAELFEVSVPSGSPVTYTTRSASVSAISPLGRHMVPVMATAMTARVTNGCAALAFLTGASNQPDIPYLAFDSTSVEYAEFSLAMPEGWNEGTVTFMPIWTHPATTVNFGVTWKLQGVSMSNDDNLATTFGTAQSSVDTGGTTSDLYIGPESSAITIGATPAAGDMVYFRIQRDPTDGSDTMAVDAYLLGIRLYITLASATDA
jgi:hypothetical protein